MSSTGSGSAYASRLVWRHRLGKCFEWACRLATFSALVFLAVLLAGILWQAWGWLDWGFLTRFDSRFPEKAGILAGLWGSAWVITLTGLLAVPIGVGAAVYLEEYARDTWLTRTIRTNLANLAGVPSIVYGILGLTVFVRMFGLFPPRGGTVLAIPLGVTTIEIPLPLGRCVLSGALTLTLLILPVVIIAAQEALRAVPTSIRHGAYALGATQWQTVRHQVLPAALPGIMTGVILALSRALGETAPLIMIGALTYIAFTPGGIITPTDILHRPEALREAPFDMFTALPIQIYNWVSHPKPEFQRVAAAGIVVLLGVLLAMNAVAIVLRHRSRKRLRW